MMCIISKERIAFCAQVEGTRGEIFATSPIAFQMHACTQWTHSDVWSQLAPTPECLFKIGDRQSEKNRWNSDWRAICNATRGIETGCGVIRHRGVSDGSDGAIPPGRKYFLLMCIHITIVSTIIAAMGESLTVDNDDVMQSNSMPFRHPQGPVQEWPQYFRDILDNSPLILCCEEWSIITVFWVSKPLASEFTQLVGTLE
jgi:hypothetical protein